MKLVLTLAILAVLLVPPLASAAPLAPGEPRSTAICPPNPLPFPPNPFVPTSPAGQLYAGATGTGNVAWTSGIGAVCLVIAIPVSVVNGICTAETGRPCI